MNIFSNRGVTVDDSQLVKLWAISYKSQHAYNTLTCVCINVVSLLTWQHRVNFNVIHQSKPYTIWDKATTATRDFNTKNSRNCEDASTLPESV